MSVVCVTLYTYSGYTFFWQRCGELDRSHLHPAHRGGPEVWALGRGAVKGLVEIVPIYFTLFSRACITTPYLSSAKACAITMGSDTSPHVLRFTGFDHRRERRRLERSMPSSPTLRRPDGEVSGSDASEGVCAAQSFIEWSTMVVPTYPEGGSHALHRCASTTIRLCESATLSGCQTQRLEEHGARDCSGRFG